VVNHVRVLAWAWIAVSALIALAAVIGMIYFLTAGDDEKTAGELLFLAIGTVPGVVGGVGLLRQRGWARVLLLVLAVLWLMAFPVGTALGAYTFWVFFVKTRTAPER
jgi:hypothetical protein